MRKPALSCILFSLAALTTAATADSRPVPLVKAATVDKVARPASLEPSEIRSQLAQWNTDIGRCYLDAAGELKSTGKLEIMLTIHRTGMLDAIDISTPSLSAKQTHKVAACVKELLSTVQFPSRRNSTTAIVPYEWQRTAAPNAGPQYSCWNPKGCH
ncbi:MAG TPA: hypothetical protein VFQ53_10525 [Kofleriaceae bacterium]|nr:hypothetical protein [Kofleriaceae bacterium]